MATIVCGGTTAEILNLTLSPSADIQIGFTHACNTVIIKARTAVDIQIRTSPSAPNYFTLASGETLTLPMVGSTKDGAVQPTNIWVRSVGGTPIIEIIGLYGN